MRTARFARSPRFTLCAILAAAVALCVAALAGCASLTGSTEGGEIPDKPVITYDPATTPEQAVAEAGPTNVRVNQDASGRDQNETTIGINPLDPDNLIGGANDAREGTWAAGYYVSTDGGSTWSDGVMPFRKYTNQGDPVVAFCGDGTALFAYLDYVGAYQPHRLVVARSTDKGSSWLGPGVAYQGSYPFADKPWMDCGPEDGSSYANRAYLSWTLFGGSGGIQIKYSDDYGQTWEGQEKISGGGVQGSVIAAGRDGRVWVFWLGPTGIEYASSTNGGSTWEDWRTASDVVSIGDTDFRRNSHPAAAIDVSGGENDGNLYVVWSDAREGDPDVFFTRSTDGGATWEEARRINDDPVGNGLDQFFPWIDVDEEGYVHVMWHDRRDDAANERMHVYVTTSRDGGATFDRNLRVTDTPSDGTLTGFLGDYAAIAAGGGVIAPLWSDLRAGTGEEDVYVEIEPAFDYDIVAGVAFEKDARTVTFEDQEPRLGTAIVYDVVQGNVADLFTADPWSSASCLEEDLPAPPADVADQPDPGEALYVLIRAQGPRGDGSHGSGSEHPDPRDDLDTAAPCAP
jgi:hypothetical protein